MSLNYPNQTVAIVEKDGLPSKDFRRWQLAITDAVNTTVPVPPPEPTTGDYLPLSTYLIGDGNILTFGSLASGGVNLALAALADSGEGALLGITRDAQGRVTGTTDATITGTAGEIDATNGDAVAGPPTLSLADVTDTGGGSLLLTTFDSKGRKTGSSAASASDVPIVDAGSYFTGTDVEAALQELGAGGGGGGGGGMTLVGTATVTGSAATTLTMSSLDLSVAGCYEIIGNLENATGSVVGLSMFYNADTTTTNYDVQKVNGNGTVSGSRENTASLGGFGGSTSSFFRMSIVMDRQGYARALMQANRESTTSIFLQLVAHRWRTASNVTSITMSSSVANSLAVGSYFKVFKVN